MLFERTMLSDKKNELFISNNSGLSCLRDNYILEFLNLSEGHKEKDLRKAIILKAPVDGKSGQFLEPPTKATNGSYIVETLG